MKRRYILAPDAARDLAHIWRYVKKESSETIAARIESEIRDKIAFLAHTPGAGHLRKDLTDAPVRFFPVYPYLIVYRPAFSGNRCESRFQPQSSLMGAYTPSLPPGTYSDPRWNGTIRVRGANGSD